MSFLMNENMRKRLVQKQHLQTHSKSLAISLNIAQTRIFAQYITIDKYKVQQ